MIYQMMWDFKQQYHKLIKLLPINLNIYLFTAGLGWLCTHLYLRLIITRYPYELASLKETLTMYHLIIYIVFIVYHMVMIYAIIYQLFNIYRKKKSNSLSSMQEFIDMFYWKPLMYLHDYLAPHVPYTGVFFLYLGKLLLKYDINNLKIFSIIFFIAPRIIVACVFFIDILYYKRLYLFIYIVGIILIPISYAIFIKMFISFSIRNTPIIEEVLLITRDNNNMYKFQVKAEYQDIVDLDHYMNLWLILVRIYHQGNLLKDFNSKLMPFITGFCSLLYLIAGVYKLYFFYDSFSTLFTLQESYEIFTIILNKEEPFSGIILDNKINDKDS